MEVFGKSTRDLIFLTCDNEPRKKAIAGLLQFPMIECASHRLNLAQNVHFSAERPYSAKSVLMKKLSSLKYAALLRKSTALKHVLRNETRWSSNHIMVKRYIELKDFFDRRNANLAPFIPNATEELTISNLLVELQHFESWVKSLQKENSTIGDSRLLFDAIIENYPATSHYLDENEDIVASPVFEHAKAKIQLN